MESKAAWDNSRPLASFGRRRGRRLRVHKQSLVDTLLPNIQITLPEQRGLSPQSIFPEKPVWLEIGFGGGEHLAHQARLHPDVGIIGCEPYLNGVGELLKSIEKEGLGNIRIFGDDARLLIGKLPDACLERVYVLYPDPWPKTRHHKRRLISKELLDTLARVMKPGSILQLATDHEGYCTWMLERLLAHPDFSWTAQKSTDWVSPPQDWLSTRYEQKALAGKPTYLSFRRMPESA